MPDPSSTPAPEGTVAHGPSGSEAATTYPERSGPAAGAWPELPGYELLDSLGQGGMGAVFKARQKAADRVVALKVILSGPHAGPAERGRFRTEIESAARLSHPNIVAVYEVGEHDGCPFVALEYCSGGTLRQKLEGTPLPPADAAALVRTLADAVARAHEKHIIHRDLKPANVLLAADGAPKIADFGLAKKLDADEGQTTTGAILGTPGYMPPEQAEGHKDIGPPADIYALGAILYECLTGRPPFKGASVLETLEQVRTREPVPVRALRPAVPRDLETIALKCLEKAPARRYLTAAALADDLGRYLDGRPIAARPLGPLGRAWRWARRSPGWAALSAAVVILLLTVAAVSTSAYVAIRGKNAALLAEAAEKERQRDLAESRASLARRTNDLFVNRVQEALNESLHAGAARDALAVLMQRGLEELIAADKDDTGGVGPRGLLAAHLKAGDLAWLAEPKTAAPHYAQGLALAEQQHQAYPRSDLAAGNLALMLSRATRIARLEKRPAEARAYLDRALKLAQGLANRAEQGDGPPLAESWLTLASIHRERGEAELAVVAAREGLKRGPTDTARQALAEALAAAAAGARSPDDKRRLRDESARVREELVKRKPNDQQGKLQLAVALQAAGDERMFAGDATAAAPLYARAQALYRELTYTYAVVSLTHRLADSSYRAATAHLHRGDKAAAARDYAECLRLCEVVVRERPASSKLLLMLARARTGQHAGAVAIARQLHAIGAKNKHTGMLFQAACGYALASEAAESKLRDEYRATAVKIVEEMVALGYKDRAGLLADPDLAPVRDDAAYRAAVGRIKD